MVQCMKVSVEPMPSLIQLKNNIQLMIADYKDTCEEREQLLYSLADVSAISPKNGTVFSFM